jgi:hypothetical protein
MADNSLFNISSAAPRKDAAKPAGAEPSAPPRGESGSLGIITAQQSVITFTGAPAAVTVMWKVLGLAIPAIASSKLFPIALSLIVGMLIYWQSATFTTKKDKVLGFVFALINSFTIAATTLGINTALVPETASPPQ